MLGTGSPSPWRGGNRGWGWHDRLVSVGRFAPSPTGTLHVGNLRTALAAWLFARAAGSRFLLRFEDLDEAVARPEHEASQRRDLESLGLAVRDGLGVAVLPRGFAGRLRDVVEVEPEMIGAESLGAMPSRALWMVVHAAKARVPKVRAVMDWAADVFEQLALRT